MIKEIIRDFRVNKKFNLFFILNISFGLIGLIGLLSFKSSFQNSINERSKNILGADLAVYNRTVLTPEKKKKIEEALNQKKILTRKGPGVKGFEDFLRITLGPKKEMDKVLQVLKKFF